jgi:urease accessory protein
VSPFSGHLRLCVQPAREGRTVLAGQSFQAPFHISKPYCDGRTLILQVVNPTAGILEGDTLASDVRVEEGAALLLTSPSASRVFRMARGKARSEQHFSVGSGGWLELWPEPLVPHLGSCFHQRTEISVAEGGELFFADYLLPGRLARGEAWAWEQLCLELRLKVAGELILQERFEQTGAELRRLATLAGSPDGAAFGNVMICSARLAADAEWKTAISALHGSAVQVGLSVLRGAGGACHSLKLVAANGDVLRRTMREVRRILSAHLPHLAADPRKL